MPDEHSVGDTAKQSAALNVHKLKNFTKYFRQNLWLHYMAEKADWQNVFVHLSVKPKIFLVSLFS